MTSYQDLSPRIHLFSLPPSDFDPLTVSERLLEQFGLPTRPEARMHDALAFWTLLFSPPLRFVLPKFDLPKRQTATRVAAAPVPRLVPSNIGRFDKSRNWSGVYLRPLRDQRFVSVAASWIVPEPDVPTVPPINPSPSDPSRDEYRSSIWVGLNGYRSYPHVTMPQIGTWQRIKLVNGQKITNFSAWWQWWSYDEVTPIVAFEDFPVQAGDTMMAGLFALANDEVIFYIKNQSTGDFSWVLVQAPANSEPLGSTAEWIVERPTTPGHIWPWRMPKLADVALQHCHALSGPRISGPRTVHNLERARFIRMQERFETPYRSALISIPERTGPTSARVYYREG